MANYRVKENLACIASIVDELKVNGVAVHFTQFLDSPKYVLVFPNNKFEVYDRTKLESCYFRLTGIRYNIKKYIDSAQYLNQFLFNHQIPSYYE